MAHRIFSFRNLRAANYCWISGLDFDCRMRPITFRPSICEGTLIYNRVNFTGLTLEEFDANFRP